MWRKRRLRATRLWKDGISTIFFFFLTDAHRCFLLECATAALVLGEKRHPKPILRAQKKPPKPERPLHLIREAMTEPPPRPPFLSISDDGNPLVDKNGWSASASRTFVISLARSVICRREGTFFCHRESGNGKPFPPDRPQSLGERGQTRIYSQGDPISRNAFCQAIRPVKIYFVFVIFVRIYNVW